MISCDVIPKPRGNPFKQQQTWHESLVASSTLNWSIGHPRLASPRVQRRRGNGLRSCRSCTSKARRSSENGRGNRTATRAATNRDHMLFSYESPPAFLSHDGAGGGVSAVSMSGFSDVVCQGAGIGSGGADGAAGAAGAGDFGAEPAGSGAA